jgi:hypothetical protein
MDGTCGIIVEDCVDVKQNTVGSMVRSSGRLMRKLLMQPIWSGRLKEAQRPARQLRCVR